jgi:hypothetical protein
MSLSSCVCASTRGCWTFCLKPDPDWSSPLEDSSCREGKVTRSRTDQLGGHLNISFLTLRCSFWRSAAFLLVRGPVGAGQFWSWGCGILLRPERGVRLVDQAERTSEMDKRTALFGLPQETLQVVRTLSRTALPRSRHRRGIAGRAGMLLTRRLSGAMILSPGQGLPGAKCTAACWWLLLSCAAQEGLFASQHNEKPGLKISLNGDPILVHVHRVTSLREGVGQTNADPMTPPRSNSLR